MVYLMELMRNFLCTDPRHQTFAILGLANDVDPVEAGLKPDYTLSVEQSFKACSVWSIMSPSNFNILSFTSELPSALDLSLPSWVPDFTQHYCKSSCW